MEGRLAARPPPGQPRVGGADGHAGRGGGLPDRPASLDDAGHQKESAVHGHARILVDVHPGLPAELLRSHSHSFNPKPRMNNLHSNDI